jgi:hypothetical protein
MSKWVMRAQFRHLCYNSFSMIYKTLQTYDVIPGPPSWPTTLQALALVTSPRLGLRQLFNIVEIHYKLITLNQSIIKVIKYLTQYHTSFKENIHPHLNATQHPKLSFLYMNSSSNSFKTLV